VTPPERPPARPSPAAEPAIRAKILIVDDDERNAFAASQALEELGHDLVIARSGEEALKRLLVDDFAVILLDLHMPGMDGYETAALIRARRRNSRIPIVFLTAIFRDEAHVFQAYSAGAVDVVFKPVDPFILRSKVQVLVDLHLKTLEVQRQAEQRAALLEENARVRIEKASAERALRRSEARQEAILQTLPIVFHSRTAEHPFGASFVSANSEALTGFGPDAFTGDPAFGLSRVHPEDLAAVTAALEGALASGVYACEFRWRCADGTYKSMLDQGVIAPAEDGQPREIFGAMLDYTERRSLEQQLAQARKMEAVGQLTGGVAHDFNNLLTVVLGNVDLLSRHETEPKRERQLGAIRHAAERGRSLTRQLLAFSRRQHLSPVTLDVNRLVQEFLPLMRQAVGESVTITATLCSGEAVADVDAAQLETALLNLAVNARDAMAEGGTLSINTSMSTPGEPMRGTPHEGAWVVVEVRDTGAGMTPEVAERVFEPFFTTKEVGKGSGLGLSQVYGFVSQSGGHIALESEPGTGTVFTLALPASESPVVRRHEPEQRAAEPQGGAERILVVEDDPAVLAMTVETLSSLGYSVTTATNARSGLKAIKSDQPIDLLFSDVAMPGGSNGVQLARKALELRPDLKVLLTSGYLGEHTQLSENEFPLIDKPFEAAALAAKIRELLEQGPHPHTNTPPKPRPERKEMVG
jgi:signal transduction histidine kinase/DNA-binding response OmpR family regulator